MKTTITSLVLLGSLLLVAPASAGFLAEKIDDGIYFVSYQRAQFVRGTILWDTEKKVQRRLDKKVNRFCLEQGHSYYKYPSLAEIARDDLLRAVWELAAGDEAQNTSDNEGSGYPYGSLEHVHKSRRLLLLGSDPAEGWRACHSDKVAGSPSPAATAAGLEAPRDASSSEGDGENPSPLEPTVDDSAPTAVASRW